MPAIRGPQFDASLLRALPYGLDAVGKLNHLAADRDALTECLRAALQAGKTDSPLAQLGAGVPISGHSTAEDRRVPRAGRLFG